MKNHSLIILLIFILTAATFAIPLYASIAPEPTGACYEGGNQITELVREGICTNLVKESNCRSESSWLFTDRQFFRNYWAGPNTSCTKDNIGLISEKLTPATGFSKENVTQKVTELTKECLASLHEAARAKCDPYEKVVSSYVVVRPERILESKLTRMSSSLEPLDWYLKCGMVIRCKPIPTPPATTSPSPSK